ncbi:hypothetical protein FEDK69T_06650 [Flavobacterium enshiense DK69]|nr:T9SS type A sorting domain-containing protein [Flavobacterium enshiense]ESU24226.1 hypothetical protein FEDK69T_06650 [Flavobacterium enshiense DK69]
MKKILLTGAFLMSALVYSQNLDSTFGTNGGVVVSQFSTSKTSDLVAGAALQSDGKMVYVGRSVAFSSFSFIARTDASGVLDTSFNTFGFRTISGSGFEAVAIQSDGKILAVGQSNIYRFNTDGSFDNTFSGDGIYSVTIAGYSPSLKSIALQSSGKIVLGGFVSNGGDNDFALIRLNADGSADTAFDFDGIATLAVGSEDDEAVTLAIQGDGKIVLGGQSFNGSDYDFAVARFNSIGTLDTSFGTNGTTVSPFGSALDLGRALDIQSDGKILMLGASNSTLSIARYNTNGQLDTSFGTDGLLLTTTPLTVGNPTNSFYFSKPVVKYLSDGKILVSGTSSNDYALFRFNADGSVDNSFGSNGTTLYNLETLDRQGFLFVKSDGKIICGGSSLDGATSDFQRGVQLQFTSNGLFESLTSFNLKQGADRGIAVIEQSSGKTVVLGQSKEGAGFNNTLVRYNTNGSLDTTFGVNGMLNLGISNVYKMIQQPDGKIILITTGADLIRLNADGQADLSFGVNSITNMKADSNNIVSFIDAIEIGPDNKIYVAFDYDSSATTNGTLFDFGLLRLNSNGTLDTTFGNNGKVNTRFNFYSAAEMNFPADLYIQADGKIILTGPLYIPLNGSYVGTTEFTNGIVRYNTDGTIDTTFGTNGKVTTQIGTYNHPFKIEGTLNNKFIINSGISTSNLHSLTRYNSNGSVDTSFGVNGSVADQPGQIYSTMVVQSDGKILKGGRSGNQFSISRYNADGSPDTSFGTSGILSTPIYYNSSIADLILLQSGKLLATGYAFNGSNDVLAQVRYTDITLGTLNFEGNNNVLLVYPNPIKQAATFEYTLENNETISIDIVDLQGKVVKSILKNKEQSVGNHKQSIDLSEGFAAGIYILNFSSAKGNQSVRIMKVD